MPEALSPDWLSWAFWAQHHESIRDLVITAAALVGIPFVIWREWLHHRQTKAASQQADTAQYRHWAQVQADRERRITDNFTRAVEQLGSDKLETRVGAIYALERIARESRADHWPIMETLTTYVRERARWSPTQELKALKASQSANWEGLPGELATDIQACLTVLGRRRSEHDRPNESLDLTRTNLRGAQLPEAHLQGAIFVGTRLDNAFLGGAHLERALLYQAHLEGASLPGAHLTNACLDRAYLQAADLEETDLTQEQFDSAISDENTKVPPHIKRRGKTATEPAEVQQPASVPEARNAAL